MYLKITTAILAIALGLSLGGMQDTPTPQYQAILKAPVGSAPAARRPEERKHAA
jgi:hypothetical protein